MFGGQIGQVAAQLRLVKQRAFARMQVELHAVADGLVERREGIVALPAVT